jgi:hypothetical protein
MFLDPTAFTDKAYTGWLIVGGLIFVFLVLYYVVIKKICPYYSDKKFWYIKKSRKNNR